MVKINFVGDIMIGDSFHMLGIGTGSSIFTNGTNYIFEKVNTSLKQADLNVGNLECVFSNVTLKPKKNLKPYLTHSSNYVESLKQARFNILNMANNHTMQYGSDTFQFTEKILIQNNIKVIGTIKNPYYMSDVDNIKFAFLGYSLRPNQFKYRDIQYIEGYKKKIIEDAKSLSRESDHVIVSLHWGDEYVSYPNQDQIDLAHEVIDAGATLIIGHHSHILQGIEYYKNGAIAYSIGNFVFDKPQLLQRKSVILQAALTKDCLRGITLIPIYINRKYQPEIATGGKKENIEKIIWRANKKIITNYGKKRKYNRDIYIGSQYMRIQFYFYFLLNFYRYPPMTFLSLLLGAIKRIIFRRNT